MAAGEWYCCLDLELDARRITARSACHAHHPIPPAERGAIAPTLRSLFAEASETAFLEAPFHCSYGMNLHLADAVYMNAGCIILDSAPVKIGARSMLGPGVQIYCADHHRDPALRSNGIEIARPVTIGEDVWIGGGAIILGGVTIGNSAIVGAGSVVTRDVPNGATFVGNPARPVKQRD